MKAIKTIISLSLALLLITALISCGGAEGPSVEDDQIRVLVPKFMQSTSKGLTELADPSQQSPFEDAGVAAGVMTTMPVLSELSPHDVKKGRAEAQIRESIGSVIYPYGFKVKLEKVQLNKDGLYCYFNIYEGEKWCGYFDYYYSTAKHCFSYKELVVVTTAKPMDGSVGEYTIIAFDYKDIPVEKWNTDKPSFKIGQLKANGEFEDNGISFQIVTKRDGLDFVSFEVNYPTMMSQNGVAASIFRPDECMEIDSLVSVVASVPNSVFYDYYKKYVEVFNSLASVETNPDKRLAYLNMPETIEILTESGFFADFDEMAKHIKLENPDGYETYEDYTALSYFNIGEKLSNVLKPMYENVDKKGILVHDNASVYNLDNKKSASDQFAFKMMYHTSDLFTNPTHRETCQYCKNHSYVKNEHIEHNGRPTLILVTNDSVENALIRSTDLGGGMICKAPYSLFNNFYHLQGQYPEKEYETDELRKAGIHAYQIALATKHMEACGLPADKAANYAANLIYSENQVFFENALFAKITTADPETFKTDFANHQPSTSI